ncbi:SP_1767 family glycosyltransferase [Streptococcus sp. zg-JUN1979]|uniref:SP_1767 family glycosyltransferase n=1 Tax=Streptococcus sp. zg-JUN1979 TaxID=3391450 RepID=UPI0039A4BAB9
MTLSQIKVKSIEDSLAYIKAHQASVARFGDGEIDIIMGRSIPYQRYDSDLARELLAILETPSTKELMVCLPDVFDKLERYNSNAQQFWRSHFEQFSEFYERHCHSDWYGSTFLSRPYIDWVDKRKAATYIEQLRALWSAKDLLIVEGKTSRSGVGNDLFANSRSIKRIICPSKNAYDKLDDIYELVKKEAQGRLVLVMLGPTAKVLVKRLSLDGIQALDIGHIDSEYEWYQMGATHKVKLAHKHTAEFNYDEHIDLAEDETYQSEIIAEIGEDTTGKKEAEPLVEGKISIIVPVYNAQAYLQRCIDSILKQTYTHFELLLINDGSTDASAKILEDNRARDERIRIVHKANEGVSATRNLGLAMATGDYITFIDSDDFVYEEYLDILYTSLVSNDADISSGNFASFNEERQSFLFFTSEETYFEKVYSPQEWLDNENNPRHNLFLTVIFTPFKLYKRSLWQDVLFPVGKVREDDATIHKVYLRAQKISFVNSAIYYYSQHEDSLSKTVMQEDISSMIANAEERIALLASLGYDISEHITSYTKRLEKCFSDALSLGQVGLAKDIKVKLDLILNHQKGGQDGDS